MSKMDYLTLVLCIDIVTAVFGPHLFPGEMPLTFNMSDPPPVVSVPAPSFDENKPDEPIVIPDEPWWNPTDHWFDFRWFWDVYEWLAGFFGVFVTLLQGIWTVFRLAWNSFMFMLRLLTVTLPGGPGMIYASLFYSTINGIAIYILATDLLHGSG